MKSFIKLSSKEREKLFLALKQKTKCSWEAIYPTLDISRTMFFNYLSGRYALPKKLFLKLIKITGVQIKDFTEFKQKKYSKKLFTYPKLDKNLAEVLGILNGDGHLALKNYEVCVVISSFEKQYGEHIKNLFKNTFKLIPIIFQKESILKIRIYSKELHKFLIKTYNLPKGNKIGKLSIPHQIRSDFHLLKAYLRGLFDTDGSIFLRRKKEPVIQITSADREYLNQVNKALILLGFNSSITKDRIFLYQLKDIIKFFQEVVPANSKHLKKYQGIIINGRG